MFSYSVVNNMWGKVKDLIVQQPREDLKDKVKKIIVWGLGNAEPLRIINTLNGSITGRTCIEVIRRYVQGVGLNIGQGDKPFIIGGKNVDRFHAYNARQVTKLRGVAIWIGRDLNNNATLKNLPFENCRLEEPDESGEVKRIHYNPYFGTPDYKREQTVIYDLYDPDPDSAKRAIRNNGRKWNGQIYYASLTDEFNPFYPSPPWWADLHGNGGGRKWMEIEKKIADFHSHNIGKGFMQQALMKVVGDPNAPIPRDQHKYDQIQSGSLPATEKYTTVKEDFERFLNEDFAGPEGDKMMVLWARVAEEFPEIEGFPSDVKHEMFQTLQELTTANIIVATQTQPVLAGVKSQGTLSKDDIANAVKLMWGNVEDEQSFLEDIYNDLLPQVKDFPQGERVNILKYSPVQMTLEDQIWNVLTLEEQRLWVEQNTDIELLPDKKPEPEPEKEEVMPQEEEEVEENENEDEPIDITK